VGRNFAGGRRSNLSLDLFDFALVLGRFKGLRARSALRAAPAAPLTRPATREPLGPPKSRQPAQERQNVMLRIYPIALDWLKAVRPLIAQIAR